MISLEEIEDKMEEARTYAERMKGGPTEAWKIDLHGETVEGVKFENFDFHRANCHGITFRECTFGKGTSFFKVNAHGALFEKCVFEAEVLEGTNLHGARFVECEFAEGMEFKRTNLSEARLEKCDLKKAKFHRANLYQSEWKDSKGSVTAERCNTQKIKNCTLKMEEKTPELLDMVQGSDVGGRGSRAGGTPKKDAKKKGKK